MLSVKCIEVIFSGFKNYCYLVFDSVSKDAVIIDPAWQMEIIVEEIELSIVNMRAVLVTHSHPDHLHLAEELSRYFNVPIFISEVDLPFAGFSGQANISIIEDESVIVLGTLNCIPILTPGHTLGSICYHIGDNLFSGDTLFTEGCGMCFEERSDPAKLYYSLKRLRSILPLHTRIHPGHKYYYDIGKPLSYLVQNNIYLQFDNIDHFIQFRMRKKQNILFQFL